MNRPMILKNEVIETTIGEFMKVEDFEQHLVDAKKALENWKSYQHRDRFDLELKKDKILKYEIYSTDTIEEFKYRKFEYFLKFSKVPAIMQEFFKSNDRFYVIFDSVYYLDEGKLHQVKSWNLVEATKAYTLVNFWIERKDLRQHIGAINPAIIDVAKKIPVSKEFENCIGIEEKFVIRKNPLLAETKAKLELMQ